MVTVYQIFKHPFGGSILVLVMITLWKTFTNIRYGVTASTVRSHRADRGSTPRIGVFFVYRMHPKALTASKPRMSVRH